MTVDDESRFVAERTRYLSTRQVGLREAIAEAVAWAQVGYTHSGIANKMDCADTTAKGYLRDAEKRYPGITTADPDADVDDIDVPSSRECPACLHEGLVSTEFADQVIGASSFGAPALVETADVVCSVCHAVKVDGEWDRATVVDARARALHTESSKKTVADIRDNLTEGIDPSRQGTGTKAAADGFSFDE